MLKICVSTAGVYIRVHRVSLVLCVRVYILHCMSLYVETLCLWILPYRYVQAGKKDNNGNKAMPAQPVLLLLLLLLRIPPILWQYIQSYMT